MYHTLVHVEFFVCLLMFFFIFCLSMSVARVFFLYLFYSCFNLISRKSLSRGWRAILSFYSCFFCYYILFSMYTSARSLTKQICLVLCCCCLVNSTFTVSTACQIYHSFGTKGRKWKNEFSSCQIHFLPQTSGRTCAPLGLLTVCGWLAGRFPSTCLWSICAK